MTKIIKLKKDNRKPKPKFKYALNDQVASLDRRITVNDLLAHMADKVSRNEWYDDCKIPYGSSKSIPSDRLIIYSKVFDCPLTDLLNEEIKATSIRERNLKLKTRLS
jgi:hypothetical protein